MFDKNNITQTEKVFFIKIMSSSSSYQIGSWQVLSIYLYNFFSFPKAPIKVKTRYRLEV